MLSDERLLTVAEMVRRGDRVADIGTDHAYLAIYLIEKGISPFVFAADINDGPLENAKSHLNQFSFSEKIELRKSDGLKAFSENELDTAVIAGMGGDIICKIISDSGWIKNNRFELILQPMSSAKDLRRFLAQNGFEIKMEKATKAAGRIYSVIKTCYCDEKRELSLFEAMVGKLDVKNDLLAVEYIKRVRRIAGEIALQLEGVKRKEKELQEYKIAIKKMDEMLTNGI